MRGRPFYAQRIPKQPTKEMALASTHMAVADRLGWLYEELEYCRSPRRGREIYRRFCRLLATLETLMKQAGIPADEQWAIDLRMAALNASMAMDSGDQSDLLKALGGLSQVLSSRSG